MRYLMFTLALYIFSHSALAAPALIPAVLTSDIQVDGGLSCGGVACTNSSLANSNTTRKLAVSSDGTIYVLFRGDQGIRVAKSTDRGASFSNSVQVSAENLEAELAISTNGDLFVAWRDVAGTGKVARSTDGGVTWDSPVSLGASPSASFHMATDGDHIYLVPQSGDRVFASSDRGIGFTSVALGSSWAFSDIHVDLVSHEIFVQVDNPAVGYYKSADFGQTFSTLTATGKNIFYSVGALSVSSAGRFIITAGSQTNLERIGVDGSGSATYVVPATSGSVTRSLAADIFGNIVVGYLDGSSNLLFIHTNDLGISWGAPVTVVTAATRANAAINNSNGDILYLYEKANHIYLTVYNNGLVGYDLEVSPSALAFGSQPVALPSPTQAISLTNSSVSPLTVTSITVSGDFAQTNDCGGSIAPSATCTLTVTFTPTVQGTRSGAIALNVGGQTRNISLSGSGSAPVPINGACGTDNGTTLTSTPTNQCTTGTASAISSGNTSYDWTCNGANGGSNATCSATRNYVVTSSSGANGSISASQTVAYNATPTFILTPSAGYTGSASGTCGGALSGNSYTTNAVTASCTVVASFALTPVNGACGTDNGTTLTSTPTNQCTTGTASAIASGNTSYDWTCNGANGGTTATCSATRNYVVTSSSGANGSISASQTVAYNATPVFTLTPNAGYVSGTVTGTCGGMLAGNSYTTNAVTAACTVVASFTQRSYTAPAATATGDITASFTGGDAGCGYSVSQYIPLTGHAASPPAGTAPAGFTFLHGLFDFTVSGCTPPGSTITMVITYPQVLPAGTVYWKYGPTPTDASNHWYQLPATISGNTATFSITDGGLGDDDLTANGAIVDQGGPGVPVEATAIPTLSEWALLLLAGLMGLFGVGAMRRRETLGL